MERVGTRNAPSPCAATIDRRFERDRTAAYSDSGEGRERYRSFGNATAMPQGVGGGPQAARATADWFHCFTLQDRPRG